MWGFFFAYQVVTWFCLGKWVTKRWELCHNEKRGIAGKSRTEFPLCERCGYLSSPLLPQHPEPMPHSLQLQIQHDSEAHPTLHVLDYEKISVIGKRETPDQNGNATITVTMKRGNERDLFGNERPLFGKTIECPVSPQSNLIEIFTQMNEALRHKDQDALFIFPYSTQR